MRPGYKQTEIGLIPEEWEVSTVGREFEVKLGKMLDAEKNVGVPKPYLGNRAVQWDRIDISDLPTVPLSRADIEKFRLRKGDLLVCEGGEVGRSAIWEAQLDECYYQKALHRLRPTRGFNVRVMAALLRQWSDRGLLTSYVTQTSIAHLPREKFIQVPMLVPPPPEQRAIAEALSDMDGLLGALDRLIAKKRDLKQAAMHQFLTGQTRLPGFHGEWKVKRLGEIGKFRNGINKAKEDFGHGHPFANLMDVFGVAKIANSSSFGLVNSTSGEKELYELRKGDVLFVRSSVKPSGVGLTTLIQEDLPNTVFSGFLLRFRDEGTLTAEYKEHCFGEASFREKLIASSTVSANTNINQVSLRALTIKFPIDRAEQTAIAEVLNEMGEELAGLERRREKTIALKLGMAQELLTGKTRLIVPELAHG